MLRSNIIIFICIFFLLLLPKRETIIPVFLIDEQPTIITKGQFSNALLLGISFEHDELQPFIAKQTDYAITYFVTADLLERSPALVKTFNQYKPVIALLGSNGEAYENNAQLFKQELAIFESHLQFTPLYFITADFQYSTSLLKEITSHQINAIAPTHLYEEKMSLKKGQFIYMPLDATVQPNWKGVEAFIQKNRFSYIEETIFDASFSTSSVP